MADEINLRIQFEGPTDDALAWAENLARGTEPITDSDIRILAAVLAETIKLGRSNRRVWAAIHAAGNLRIDR